MMKWDEPTHKCNTPKIWGPIQNKTWAKYIHVAEEGCIAGTVE